MTVTVHSGSRPGAAADALALDDGAVSLVVVEREQIADDVVMLALRDPGGGELPGWMPGAHIHVTGPSGIERQYSLCGDPDDVGTWRIAVLREVEGRGGSEALCTRVGVGDTLPVRGPVNRFRLVDRPRYLFIAGGIGITPLLPMVRLVAARDRPWQLIYLGRGTATMAFAEEVARCGDGATVHPSSRLGRFDLGTLLGTPDTETAVYCCGPSPLIDAVTALCASWPDDALHVERFTGTLTAEQAAAGAAFDVELAASGLSVHVPDGTSILDALEDVGVDAPSSCLDGVCGTCETRVLGGVPDHRDGVLTVDERAAGETMMICVSRASGPRLVLDL